MNRKRKVKTVWGFTLFLAAIVFIMAGHSTLASAAEPADELVSRYTGMFNQLRAELTAKVSKIDLEKAKYVEIDKANRTAVLQVPSPKVLYATLDHDHTRIHSLTRTGFWQAAIGSAGEDQLVDEAMGHAQRVLVEAGSDRGLARRAQEQAQRVIGGLFGDVGWEVQLR